MRLPFFSKPRAEISARLSPPRNRVPKAKGTPWALLLPLLFVSLLIGMVGGLDSPILLLIVVGAVFAILLFLMANLYGLIVILFVATFLVQGTALYFLRVKAAVWVTVGFALMFLARTLLEMFLRRRPKGEVMPAREGSAVMVAAGLFLLCFGMSTVINRIPAAQLLSSTKATLPMFGVLMALYWMRWDQRHLKKLWGLMILVALLQLPLVVYQHFFIAGAHTYDSIVGTFGGTPGFGGNSAGLVIFMLTIMVYALARWDRGLMSTSRAAMIVIVGVGIVLLGEVKAAFLWLPLVTFWVLRKRIMKNALFMVSYIMLIVVFVVSTYAVYTALYWGKAANKGHTVAEKFDARGGYFFDPHSINYQTGEVSRAASLAIWFNDGSSSLPRRLVGFGPGASKPSGLLGAGEVARRFAPLYVDATALAILLWDEGILGALAFTLLILVALRTGRRVAANKKLDGERLAIVETCVPMLLVLLSTLVYNRNVMEEPTAELLLMFCIGSILQIGRFGAADVAAATPADPPSRTHSLKLAVHPAGLRA